jgi:hypothetical protein
MPSNLCRLLVPATSNKGESCSVAILYRLGFTLHPLWIRPRLLLHLHSRDLRPFYVIGRAASPISVVIDIFPIGQHFKVETG